jgi:hypothetical protein
MPYASGRTGNPGEHVGLVIEKGNPRCIHGGARESGFNGGLGTTKERVEATTQVGNGTIFYLSHTMITKKQARYTNQDGPLAADVKSSLS